MIFGLEKNYSEFVCFDVKGQINVTKLSGEEEKLLGPESIIHTHVVQNRENVFK